MQTHTKQPTLSTNAENDEHVQVFDNCQHANNIQKSDGFVRSEVVVRPTDGFVPPLMSVPKKKRV